MLSNKPINQRSWIRKPVTWLAITLTVLIGLLAGVVGRELIAKRQLNQQLSDLKSKGVPVDNSTMESYFVSTTSTENSVEWRALSGVFASSWIFTLGADLPYVGNKSTPTKALRGEEWSDAAKAEAFLKELTPWMERLHQVAEKTKRPVWHPIHFNGWSTLLGPVQESRSFSRVLSLDFDYALYSKDRQRAIQDLKTLRSSAEAYHWDAFVVSELVYEAHVYMLYQAIFRGMRSSIWNADDLQEIKLLVGERQDFEDRWTRLQQNEMAMSLAGLDSDDVSLAEMPEPMRWFAKLPSSKLRFVHESLESRYVGSGGLLGIAMAKQPEEMGKYGMISQMLASSRTSLARAMLNLEESRRLAHAAIAIKQYKLLHGSFPQSLEILQKEAQLGLAASSIQGVDQSPFGYRQTDDTAWVWNTRPTGNEFTPIAKELPEHDPNTGEVQRAYGAAVIIN